MIEVLVVLMIMVDLITENLNWDTLIRNSVILKR